MKKTGGEKWCGGRRPVAGWQGDQIRNERGASLKKTTESEREREGAKKKSSDGRKLKKKRTNGGNWGEKKKTISSSKQRRSQKKEGSGITGGWIDSKLKTKKKRNWYGKRKKILPARDLLPVWITRYRGKEGQDGRTKKKTWGKKSTW